MGTGPFELDRYTIRRKVLKILGASFHVFDPEGRVVGFSNQKAFKLREDIRVFTDESATRELLRIQARQIIDFSAAYDIVDGTDGSKVGMARRKGLKSILRDSWELCDPQDRPIATLQEDGMALAMVRRLLSGLVPQSFDLSPVDGRGGASLSQRFNPFVYRLDVEIDRNLEIDRRAVMGLAVLVAAIEGRQD